MTLEDDPYRDDPKGFQLLDPEQYAALSDDEKWAYLREWGHAEERSREGLRSTAPCKDST
jgi:hypothetical protein